MKILMFSSNFKPERMGGADKSVMRLAEALVEKGHLVEILTYGKKPFLLGNLKVTTIPEPMDTPERFGLSIPGILSLFNLSYLFRLYSCFKDHDLIHIHNIHSYSLTLYTILVLKLMKKPVIWTAHDYWFICPKGSLLKNNLSVCEDYDCNKNCYNYLSIIKKFNFKRRYLTNLLKYADKVIAPSHAVRDILIDFGMDENKIIVVPFGIDISDPQKHEKNRQPRLLYVGYIDERKGCKYLILSISKVREIIPEIKLFITGTGPKQTEYINLANELGLDRNITFLGRVPDAQLRELYISSDIIVIPSIWPEVFCLVGLEAMNYGKPVIACNIGGIPDWLGNGITGFLVEPGKPDQIAENILKLLQDDRLYNSMVKNSKEKLLKEFNMRSYIEKMEKEYNELIS